MQDVFSLFDLTRVLFISNGISLTILYTWYTCLHTEIFTSARFIERCAKRWFYFAVRLIAYRAKVSNSRPLFREINKWNPPLTYTYTRAGTRAHTPTHDYGESSIGGRRAIIFLGGDTKERRGLSIALSFSLTTVLTFRIPLGAKSCIKSGVHEFLENLRRFWQILRFALLGRAFCALPLFFLFSLSKA